MAMDDPKKFEVIEHYWQNYFEGEAKPQPDDGRIQVIKTFKSFLDSKGGSDLLQSSKTDLGSQPIIKCSYDALVKGMVPFASDFAHVLKVNPQVTLGCFGLALCLLRAEQYPHGRLKGPKISLRIEKLGETTEIGNLKANTIGTFVQITGSVIRASSIQPMVVRGEFVCMKCGASIERGFEDGKYSPPARCVNTKCRSKTFDLLREGCAAVDLQRLKVQEVEGRGGADDPGGEAGRMPKTLEVELTEDLVDTAVPGDVVTLCGEVKSVNAELAHGARGGGGGAAGRRGQTSLYVLYLKANSLVNTRLSRQDNSSNDQSSAALNQSALTDFSEEERACFEEIRQDPKCFELLVHSLCPTIYGHEKVKAGLTLALFGGSPREGEIAVRSDIHMLVVGDPGLGKSQMLQAVNKVAPRSVYVGGNTASTTGLTVTLAKDGKRGDVGLEAGALVLSDQGVCCIDEFDKMACDYHALLEAMEQQQISIAKSGVVASLSARCSVVAAANPVGGHYRRGRTLAENLRLSAALLSRFDLVCILLDRPDAAHDRKLSEHILRMHALAGGGAHGGGGGGGGGGYAHDPSTFSQHGQDGNENGAGETLTMRLKRAAAECTADPIPPELLRKYIAWARKTAAPKLSLEAAQILQGMYLTLRREAVKGRSMPITTRQLESLIRLAQARAKAELRLVVTAQDANDVIELMQESMLEASTDDTGSFDFETPEGSRATSLAKKVKMFVADLTRKAEARGTPIFHWNELIQIPQALGFEVNDFDNFMEVLAHQNYLLKKGHNIYHLTTATTSQHSQQILRSQQYFQPQQPGLPPNTSFPKYSSHYS